MQTAIACFCSRELSTSKDNLFLQKSKCLTFHLRDNCSPLVNNESPPMIMQRNAGTLHSSLYFMKGNHRHAHLGGGTVSMRGEGERDRERERESSPNWPAKENLYASRRRRRQRRHCGSPSRRCSAAPRPPLPPALPPASALPQHSGNLALSCPSVFRQGRIL